MGMMVIFSVVVLCLSMATQQAVCERYHIVASLSDPCPGEHNGEYCFTLQQFISEFYSLSVGQHLTLELEPGIHTLASRSLSITRKNSLEIIGHNATINCSRYISRSFDFQSIEQVSISGINFIDCHRIYLNTVYNATISGSKFNTHLRPLSTTGLELRITNVAIHSCTFVGLSTGVYLYSSNSSINFCTFVGQSTGVYLYSSSSSINSCNFVGNRRGMRIQHSDATIFNCTLRDNRISVSYGSAIYIYNSSLMITQSSFINNTASSGGGAIYMGVYLFTRIESSVTIDGCIFANNAANQGGAIYINRFWQIFVSQPLNCIIYRSIFINNNAIVRGGAISAANNVSIVDSIFGYNTAPQCAAFSLNGISTGSSLFESTIFLYNQAINSTAEEDDNVQYLGGVACVRDTSFVASNCTFSHNTAKHSGGVLHAEDSSVTISSSSFHNNSARIDGGVLYTYLLPSTYVLQRCSFTNNRAGDDGGAIYIGKTRSTSTLDIGRSLFSHNAANDRGGAIIVFGSTIGMEQTDMHSNKAASGDDIGMCTASNITGSSTYFTYFQQRTYSTPTTECLFYSRLTRIFHNPTPEDHSNINLAQYLVLSNVSSDRNNLPMATTGTTDVDTTNPERELLMDLRNKITETSSVQYVIFAISLLFVIVLVIAIVMKFKTVCLKKKERSTECYDLDKCNTGTKYKDHNESPEILYEEPVWKDDRSDAIKVRPNAGYAKH